MAEVFVIYDSALKQVLQGSNGPVYQDITRRTLKVHARAVELCPVDTGALRSSIRWVIAEDSKGIVGVVGTDKEYAEYVHDGTRYMEARPFLLSALQEAAN